MAANSPRSFLFPEEDGSLPITACHQIIVTEEHTSRLVSMGSRIRSIAHLKQSSGPYHELLLIDVVCDTPPKASESTYILIERCGDFAPRPSGAAPLRSVGSTSLASLSDANASDVAWLPGPNTRRMYPFQDYVSLLRRHGFQLLRTAVVSNAMSAAQLFVMAKTLRDKKPGYQFLDGQCYWYAGMLVDMVEKEFRASIVEHIPKAGRYKSVRVTTIDPTAVTEVLATYSEAWKKFSTEDKNDDESKKVALEQERRVWEEERKRLEEERKRAEEERKRTEEERKRTEAAHSVREEDCKRIEDERKRLEEERKRIEDERRLWEAERKLREEAERTGEDLLSPQSAVANRQPAASKAVKGRA